MSAYNNDPSLKEAALTNLPVLSPNHSWWPLHTHLRVPGMPAWLLDAAEALLACLPEHQARLWPSRFLSAIRPGADLNAVQAPLIAFLDRVAPLRPLFTAPLSTRVHDAADTSAVAEKLIQLLQEQTP